LLAIEKVNNINNFIQLNNSSIFVGSGGGTGMIRHEKTLTAKRTATPPPSCASGGMITHD
jgi:hypothetical protein